MTALKNIIFDLGGVLLNIDYKKTEQAFINLGFEDFNKMYNQYSADALFSSLETGSVSTDDFFNILINAAPKPLTINELTNAWNAMILDFREQSLSFLESLKPRYNLYLLSNTNAIHQQAFFDLFSRQLNKPSLNDYFIKAYYSHETGYRKPNEDIFKFVLNDAGITSTESLFIDDSYNNIETAKKMGFQTFLLQAGLQIEDLAL